MRTVNERHPHLATRAVVDALGHEAPRTLYRAFDEFNATHFGGRLGAPLVLVTPASSRRAFGDYAERDVHGLRSTIRISPSSYGRGERFALDVLLHEMVHAHQSEVDGQTEPGYRGHGPRFAAKCNEIGARLGLPEVGVKKRKGLPDCAQWPICVRPDGYYPEVHPAKKPKAPAKDRPPSEDGSIADADALQRALKQAYETGRRFGETHAKLYYARQVRRRARRLRHAYGESNPRLAELVIAEAETIARAIQSSGHTFYEMRYPRKRSRNGVVS